MKDIIESADKNWITYGTLDKSIASMLNLLRLIIVLSLYKRIPLVLGNKYWIHTK